MWRVHRPDPRIRLAVVNNTRRLRELTWVGSPAESRIDGLAGGQVLARTTPLGLVLAGCFLPAVPLLPGLSSLWAAR